MEPGAILGRSAIASVSADARIDASGLRSSCDTSAAKRSVKRRCASSRPVSASRARASSPISSRRAVPRKARSAAAVMIDQRLGVVAQLPQRPDDGQRADDGEDQRHRERERRRPGTSQPHVVEPLQDAERRLRHQHDADDPAADRHRPGPVERHRSLAAGRQPGRGGVAAGEGAVDFGRRGCGRARRGSSRPRRHAASLEVSARQRGRTTRRRDRGRSRRERAHLRRARSPAVSSRPSRPGTRCESASDAPVRRDDPQPHVRRLLEAIEHALRGRAARASAPAPAPRRAQRPAGAPAAPSPAPAARAGAARRRRDTRGRRPAGTRAAR